MQPRFDKRLLVVDDCETTRRLIALVFASSEVLIVGEGVNGRDAIELVEQMRPDVVLMDYHMPVMDGITAARLLKQQPHPPAIVLFTSDDSVDLPGDAATAGVDVLLAKGCSHDVLRQTVVGAARAA